MPSASATPIVAIRSMGLGLESIVGCLDASIDEEVCAVPEVTLRGLIRMSNDRFVENAKRRERFWQAFQNALGGKERRGDGEGGVWEDREVRRERLRREGLERAQKAKIEKEKASAKEELEEVNVPKDLMSSVTG
jgi:tRNA wybutosine-synthesizing protein 3